MAILTWLANIFGLGSTSKRDEFKSLVEHAIIKLELILERTSELRYRFESRYHELKSKIISLVSKGDRDLAAVYAGEVVQVKNILKIIKMVENMIVQTKERLRTVSDSRQLAEVLMTFGAALEEVKDQARNIYPSLAYTFEEISRNVKTLIVQTSIDGIVSIDPLTVSKQAIEILNEAAKKADIEVKKNYPEPPVEPVMRIVERREEASSTAGFPRPPSDAPARPSLPAAGGELRRGSSGGRVEHAAVGEARRTGSPRRRPRKSLEELLLEYIREHGGYLDVRDFIERYGFSRDEVFDALSRMAEKGIIMIS